MQRGRRLLSVVVATAGEASRKKMLVFVRSTMLLVLTPVRDWRSCLFRELDVAACFGGHRLIGWMNGGSWDERCCYYRRPSVIGGHVDRDWLGGWMENGGMNEWINKTMGNSGTALNTTVLQHGRAFRQFAWCDGAHKLLSKQKEITEVSLADQPPGRKHGPEYIIYTTGISVYANLLHMRIFRQLKKSLNFELFHHTNKNILYFVKYIGTTTGDLGGKKKVFLFFETTTSARRWLWAGTAKIRAVKTDRTHKTQKTIAHRGLPSSSCKC